MDKICYIHYESYLPIAPTVDIFVEKKTCSLPSE